MSNSRPTIARALPVVDMDVDESGRVVTALAATFDDPYEVRDPHGHYIETINRSAFNRFLGRGFENVQALFNHGRTLAGTPSDRYSMPLGTPLEIRPEAGGLLTRTRYAKTPLGDEVLSLIEDGAIRAQSFQGSIYGSRKLGIDRATGLATVERTQLSIKDYGPAPFVVNTGAEILAVRSLMEQVDNLTDEERAELARLLEMAPQETPGVLAPVTESAETETPTSDASQPGDPPPGPALDPVIEAEQAQRRRHHQN